MRRALFLMVACLAVLAPGAARADVIRFDGDARIDLYERLDHNDTSRTKVSEVDLDIELHGARGLGSSADAIGHATIKRTDGSTTTIALNGGMYPPEGSGGFVHATGVGNDDSIYCFRIWDLSDAPTPRPDRVIAAFEPRDRFTAGFAATPSSAAVTDICYALESKFGPPHSGDFAFSKIA
ncbi:MAG TPA: hypothetical protein VM600_08055 [Actinomycetota bacterium]|nr:hypothetical protein [Actinomycetota bacterium]